MAKGLPDAKVVIQDGGLGAANDAAGGVHLKIGVSTKGVPNRIYRVSSPSAVIDQFGKGELVSALLDSMQVGAREIIVVPAAASVAGTIGTVVRSGTGTMTLSVSGQPNHRYNVIVKINKAGGLNEAQYVLSFDGGQSYQAARTIPTNGIIAVDGTGLTLTFSGSGAFAEGDEYRFETTGPQMSNQDFIAAMNVVKNNSLEFEYIHVVGSSGASLWSMCASEANALEELHKPIHFVCEARRPDAGESIDEWVQDLIKERQSFTSNRVSVVAPLVRVAALDGQRWTNLAAVYCGILARCRVSESPGKVMSFPLSNVLSLMEGMDNTHIKALDEAGFITARSFEGLPGFYITNGRMMAQPGSDFEFVEIRRTVDKAARLVRQASVRFVQSEADADGLDNLLANIAAPLYGQMMTPGAAEIREFHVNIPLGQNVTTTRSIEIDLAIVPIPIMKWITVRLKLQNPVL